MVPIGGDKNMGFIQKLQVKIRYQKRKIRTKLFISYFLIIFLSITMIGIFSFYHSRRSIEQKTQMASRLITSQIQKNLELNYEQIRNLMLLPYYNTQFINGVNQYDLMDDLERNSFYQDVRDFFSRSFFVPTRKDFVGIYIFLRNGNLLYNSRSIPETGEQEFFTRHLSDNKELSSDGRVRFSGAYLDPVSQAERYLFSASIRIQDISDYNRYTTVIAEFDFDVIDDICEDAGLFEQSRILLVDGKGRVVYSTGDDSPAELFHPETFSKMSGMADTFWTEIGGVTYMATYNHSPLSGWKSVTLIPQKSIFEASNKIKQATLLIAGLSFLITIILSLLFSSRITKPLMQLQQSVANCKVGGTKDKLAISCNDEIGTITDSINTMIYEMNDLLTSQYLYQLKLKESEIELLCSKINPHFLYNTLESIRSMADYHKVEDIASMVRALGDMFRYSIQGTHGSTAVREEVQHVKDYLLIQTIRFGERLQYNLNIESGILEKPILRLILQPIVENAIQHGLERKKGVGLITINGYESEQGIVFEVIDNGLGIHAEKLRSLQQAIAQYADNPGRQMDGSHIGLLNVHARIVLQCGSNYGISLESRAGEETHVIIVQPVQNSTADKAIEDSVCTK